MADPDSPPEPDVDTAEDTSAAPGRRATTGAPRWVKVLSIIALVVLVLLVIITLAGGGPGGHGPVRHTSPGDLGGQSTAASCGGEFARPA